MNDFLKQSICFLRVFSCALWSKIILVELVDYLYLLREGWNWLCNLLLNIQALSNMYCLQPSCRVPLDQQERRNHRFFLKQFTQAATYFKSPSLSSYKCFSPLQPQPRPHQSPQVTSPHQAGLLSQSGIKGGPSTKHGLVYYLEQTSILLTRKSGMAPYSCVNVFYGIFCT